MAKKNYVIDSRGIKVPADENKDCPGCKQKAPAAAAHKSYADAFVSIQAALNSLSNFTRDDSVALPSMQAVAAIQDQADQVLERLWQKTYAKNESQVLETQEITESLDTMEDPSAME